MKKTASIATTDVFLYQKIYLLFKSEYDFLPADSRGGCSVLFSDIDCPISNLLITPARIITLSRKGEGELLVPFKNDDLRSIISAKPAERLLELKDRMAILGGKKIKLTEVEFSLLECLFLAGGEFVCREDLLSRVWGDNAESGVLSVYIHYLREKLEGEGDKIIISSRGGGYKISPRFISKREEQICYK